MAKKPDPACPIEIVLSMISGRWKTLVLYTLFKKTLRYSEIQRAIPGITPKMLTQQLRELERDGLIERKIYAEVPPRVEYTTTALGLSLRPSMAALSKWAKEYEASRPKRRGAGKTAAGA